jgi:cobalt-precorrin-5B (C1)-methyltransferase
VGKSKRPLKSGYTTGACATAAAKAAAELLLFDDKKRSVNITLPGGAEVTFKLKAKKIDNNVAYASVIKDAGDDPDVTNKAEIGALVSLPLRRIKGLTVTGGKGVGWVTRQGLAVKPGHAAINPVPMKMIRSHVKAIMKEADADALDVKITVPLGETLAKKTLNMRLGIIGGLSILGTTGIVKPLSTEAWTSTIKATFNVAEAAGLDTVVMSSGRTSERVHMEKYGFPEEVYAMMGDHVAWSLKEAGTRSFKKIYLVAQWAKMLKIAMGTPDTHVRAGAFSVKKALIFLDDLGVGISPKSYNTAREIFDSLGSKKDAMKVCKRAAKYANSLAGQPVRVVLIGYDGKVVGEV